MLTGKLIRNRADTIAINGEGSVTNAIERDRGSLLTVTYSSSLDITEHNQGVHIIRLVAKSDSGNVAFAIRIRKLSDR